MQTLASIRIAIAALSANKLRSLLTMLGVIIGVAAVITLQSVGSGVEQYVVERFSSVGTNLLFVVPGQTEVGATGVNRAESSSLTLGDAAAIADPLYVPAAVGVAPELVKTASAARNARSIVATVRGVTPEYQQVRSWSPASGDFLTEADLQKNERVVVIGQGVRDRLFVAEEHPIGQTIRINGLVFRVIGVMEERGGGGPVSLDDSILVPLSTAQSRLFPQQSPGAGAQISSIAVQIASVDDMDRASRDIAELLRDRHRISFINDDDFNIVNQNELISIFGDIVGTLSLFLSLVAGISLVVGGIGIMNIMLVSVTERTREIGLRKAVGARRQDILKQFLTEAMTLSVIGGLLGTLLGAIAALLANALQDYFQASVQPGAVLVAILFSLAVGLFFGGYPAYRASRLHPIEALRHE